MNRIFIAVSILIGCQNQAFADVIQNFDSPGTPYSIANPTYTNGGMLAGGPTGNYFRLVQGIAFGNHPFEIAFPLTAPGAQSKITVDFDFRMIPVFGKADGLGFLLLPTSQYGTSGNSGGTANGGLEPTIPGTFAIVFDIFDNDANPGPPEPNNNHVQINFDQLFVNVATPPFNLASGQWHHAHFEINGGSPNSTVTVILTPSGGLPVTLFSNAVVPGFQPFEARPAFYATLGAEWAHHDIDNIQVQFSGSLSQNVPEPSSILLFGALGFAAVLVRRMSKASGEKISRNVTQISASR